MKTCLVMGAAGYIGSHLVPYLHERGYQVIACARRPCRLPQGVGLRLADALVPSSLPAAFAGVDTLFYLVHAMGSGEAFHRYELQG
ncbi:MAG: NAD-dependent epimerase/dehydratase family protein, partial [Vibrionaceae bacterium]